MSEFSFEPIEKIEAEAAAYNCEVVIAKECELQFDLDSQEALERFSNFYNKDLHHLFGDKLPRVNWESKSGNTHVVLTMPHNMSVEERIALQACGGSDPAREFAALCCHWKGSPNPVLLFRPLPAPPNDVKESN